MKIEKIDMICPTHFVDFNHFTTNLKSWFKELPIKTLYLGCNNPTMISHIRSMCEGYPNLEFVDQIGIKTLGMQIADLMKRTDTEWFVYCHADVRIVEYSWLIMDAIAKEDNVGIVEFDRVQYQYDNPPGYPTVYPHYYDRPRSFSGFQLFRKEALGDFLDAIEDDYIYRNEDIIFQNVCKRNGFVFRKTRNIHVHTCSNVNHNWTPQGENNEDAIKDTHIMQIKGIVKYCTPDEITTKAWRDAFGVCSGKYGVNIFEFLDGFVKEVNPKWEKVIKETIGELLGKIYK